MGQRIIKINQMKKILTTIAILLSVSCVAQDSVKITISPQGRDLEYILSFIFNSDAHENLFDSIKVKYRVGGIPPALTGTPITAYTQDWILAFTTLKHDATAIKAGCTGRIEGLLRAVNQPYLIVKLDVLDTNDIQTFQSMRQFGRLKGTKKLN